MTTYPQHLHREEALLNSATCVCVHSSALINHTHFLAHVLAFDKYEPRSLAKHAYIIQKICQGKWLRGRGGVVTSKDLLSIGVTDSLLLVLVDHSQNTCDGLAHNLAARLQRNTPPLSQNSAEKFQI